MQAVGAPKHWLDSPPAVDPLQFRATPMLAAAVCFAAGDAIAIHWQPPAVVIGALLVLFCLACWGVRRGSTAAVVPVLGLWILVGCVCAQIQRPVARQTQLASFADGLSRTVQGRVIRIREFAPDNSSPDQQSDQSWALGPGAWEPMRGAPVRSVDLEVGAVENVTPDISTMKLVSGGIRITLMDANPPLHCGDVIELPLRLRLPDVYRDAGAWSYLDYLHTQNIGAIATAHTQHMKILEHSSAKWSCRLAAAQTWASGRLRVLSSTEAGNKGPGWLRLSQDDAAMLSAILVGDRTQLNGQLRLGFERTGTFHLFVVSGLHVVLLVGGLLWCLRRLRIPEGAVITIALTAGFFFALLTGFGDPIQRALAMTAAYLLARWIGRDTSPLNALGIAAVIILAVDPRALFEAGFQMTTLVIIGAAGLAQPLEARSFHPRVRALRDLDTLALDPNIPPPSAQMRVRLRLIGELWATLLHPRLRRGPVWMMRFGFAMLAAVVFGVAVEICMVLPMANYFHRATLLALPTNLLLIPLIAILLGLTIVTFCVSLVSLSAASIPAACTALLLHAIRAIVNHIGQFRLADLRVPAPPTEALVVASAAIIFACIALRMQRRVWVAASCAALLAAPLAALWPAHALVYPGFLEVTALDVGQGDSLLVVSPEGKTLLVDSGGPVGPQNKNATWDIGEEVVAPYLWSRRIRRLDAIMLTHAHSDHMGGMPSVLRDLRPRELWIGIQPGDAPAMRALLTEAQSLHITIRRFHAGDAFDWSGLHASVLAPENGYSNPGAPQNNDSLVMRLAYKQGSVLLEGDAEWASEVDMLLNHRISRSTLLKIGHHGSKTSTADAFLAAVAPREAVISVGVHNTFGHPRWEVLNKLEQAHVQTWRTDREGAETFLIAPDGSISERSAASTP